MAFLKLMDVLDCDCGFKVQVLTVWPVESQCGGGAEEGCTRRAGAGGGSAQVAEPCAPTL